MIYGEDVLDDHEELKKIKGDIRDYDLLKKLVPGHDAVIHLAAYAGVRTSLEQPQMYMMNNIII